jgi:hypothetical protein
VKYAMTVEFQKYLFCVAVYYLRVFPPELNRGRDTYNTYKGFPHVRQLLDKHLEWFRNVGPTETETTISYALTPDESIGDLLLKINPGSEYGKQVVALRAGRLTYREGESTAGRTALTPATGTVDASGAVGMVGEQLSFVVDETVYEESLTWRSTLINMGLKKLLDVDFDRFLKAVNVVHKMRRSDNEEERKKVEATR